MGENLGKSWLDGYYLSEGQKEVVGVIVDHKNEICRVLLNSGKNGESFFERMLYSVLKNFRYFNLWKLSGHSVDVEGVTDDEVLSKYDWLDSLLAVIPDKEQRQQLLAVYRLKYYKIPEVKLKNLKIDVKGVFEKHSSGGIYSIEDFVWCNKSLYEYSKDKIEIFDDEIVYHYSDELDVKLLFKYSSMWYLDDISYDFKNKELDDVEKYKIILDFYNFINR